MAKQVSPEGEKVTQVVGPMGEVGEGCRRGVGGARVVFIFGVEIFF